MSTTLEWQIMRKHGMSEDATDALLDKISGDYMPTRVEAAFLVEFFRTNPRFVKVADAIASKYQIPHPPPPLEVRLRAGIRYYGGKVGRHLLGVVGTIVLFTALGLAATALDAAYRAIGFIGVAVLTVVVLALIAQRKS